MIDRHDTKIRRCPMLGHEIAFAYCRQPGRSIPCARIYDCWWERFDIRGFLEAHYPPEDLAALSAPRPGKVATLFQIVQRVQGRGQS
jgi:hypothetical protein